MKLNMDDGTISFDMPRRNGKAKHIKLRRPEMEELFSLWEEVDRVSARENAGATPDDDDDADEAPEPVRRSAKEIVLTMRANLKWTRAAVNMLGPEGLYEKGDGEELFLADQDLGEPGWFVNGTLAGQWLLHWQSVPLDLGPTGPVRVGT